MRAYYVEAGGLSTNSILSPPRFFHLIVPEKAIAPADLHHSPASNRIKDN